jgi:hypothetical protein
MIIYERDVGLETRQIMHIKKYIMKVTYPKHL